tara:strand:- start:98 stop:910 length:813 start_codon:yes stop_codon:yes gene_type:complete
MARDTGWSWKSEEPGANAGLNLRYEPGGWGDLFKSAWSLEIADALATLNPTGPLELLDPFAGAPDYPLLEPVRERLKGLPAGRLVKAVARHGERFPSTARLILERWGERGRAQVYDLDAARREGWVGRAGVEVIDLQDGAEALLRPQIRPPTLVHVDPYDLFERFEGLLHRGLGAGPCVLFYLFNKAPRSVKARNRYLDLRARLGRLLEGDSRALLVGRIPSDAVLPRAYHELLFVAPPALCSTLEGPLRQLARDLHTQLATAGAFESTL